MSYSDVRSMPLPYRRWFLDRLVKEFKKQSDARKKVSDESQGLVDIPMGDMASQMESLSNQSAPAPNPFAQGRSTKFSNE